MANLLARQLARTMTPSPKAARFWPVRKTKIKSVPAGPLGRSDLLTVAPRRSSVLDKILASTRGRRKPFRLTKEAA